MGVSRDHSGSTASAPKAAVEEQASIQHKTVHHPHRRWREIQDWAVKQDRAALPSPRPWAVPRKTNVEGRASLCSAALM